MAWGRLWNPRSMAFPVCYSVLMNRTIIARAGFTLIELLVVISIIGTLSSILLSAMNTSRNKAVDASIKENMHNVRAAAALDYDGNNNSYGTTAWVANATSFTPGNGTPGATAMFLDKTIGGMLAQVALASGALSYVSNNTSWVIISKLKGPGYWCVDSAGTAVAETGQYDVPTPVYNYGGSVATTVTCK